ncbi:hypothetical protein Plhal304r1_c031g0101611 [Plasmopara halstedii]
MSASNDVDMGASLRLGILHATDGFTLDGLHKQKPKFSDTLPKTMEETLRKKPTCLDPNPELQSVMKEAQSKSEEAKKIRQGHSLGPAEHESIRDTRDWTSRNRLGEKEQQNLNSELLFQRHKTTAKNEHLPSSQPVVIGILRGNQASSHFKDWLKQHSLNVIDVPENGNCVFGAFIAAVSGFSGPGKTKYSDGVEKEAEVWKERILAVCEEYVMLEAEGGAMRLPNLRHRLKELYSSEEWVTSEDPTQIMNRLIRHCAESGNILVRELAPYVFRGRAAGLHAAAGLLQEPIYVIEADDTGHIHAWRYCYQNKTGINGISKEMGCDFNMTIPELNKFMRTARQHRVLPTMLLYRRRRNGGDHFQALKFEDHLYQDFLVQKTTDVHPNMRERLDDVHSILNMPPVDATPQWEFDLQEEEERHEAAQQLMSTSQDEMTVEDRVVRREDREAYPRILGLQGRRKTWTNEDQEQRKRMMEANLTKMKK